MNCRLLKIIRELCIILTKHQWNWWIESSFIYQLEVYLFNLLACIGGYSGLTGSWVMNQVKLLLFCNGSVWIAQISFLVMTVVRILPWSLALGDPTVWTNMLRFSLYYLCVTRVFMHFCCGAQARGRSYTTWHRAERVKLHVSLDSLAELLRFFFFKFWM